MQPPQSNISNVEGELPPAVKKELRELWAHELRDVFKDESGMLDVELGGAEHDRLVFRSAKMGETSADLLMKTLQDADTNFWNRIRFYGFAEVAFEFENFSKSIPHAEFAQRCVDYDAFLSTFTRPYHVVPLVRQQTGKTLTEAIKAGAWTWEYPETMTPEQREVVAWLHDDLMEYVLYDDPTDMSQRLSHEAEVSQKLDELKALGLGIFVGSLQPKLVLKNSQSWMHQAMFVVVATTGDPRIKRETDGTEFIMGAIPKKRGGSQKEGAGSDKTAAATASGSDDLKRIAANVEAFGAKLADFQKAMTEGVSAKNEPTTTHYPKYFFQKVGDFWDVRFDGGQLFHIEDSLGVKYIDYLLHHPNEHIFAFDLEIVIQPEKAQARSKDSIQNDSDNRAMDEYIKELETLGQEYVNANERKDATEAKRLSGQIERIQAEVEKCGHSTDTGERARGNVTKAIAAVRQKLLKGEKYEKAFGGHILQFVSTGYKCIYHQPEKGIWK